MSALKRSCAVSVAELLAVPEDKTVKGVKESLQRLRADKAKAYVNQLGLDGIKEVRVHLQSMKRNLKFVQEAVAENRPITWEVSHRLTLRMVIIDYETNQLMVNNTIEKAYTCMNEVTLFLIDRLRCLEPYGSEKELLEEIIYHMETDDDSVDAPEVPVRKQRSIYMGKELDPSYDYLQSFSDSQAQLHTDKDGNIDWSDPHNYL